MSRELKEELKKIVIRLREIGDELSDTARQNDNNNSGDVYDGASEATSIYNAAMLIDKA